MSTLVIAAFRLTRDDYVNIQTFISSGNDIDDCIHWPLSESRHNIHKRKRYFCESAHTNHKYHVELLQLQNDYKTDKENCTFDKVQRKVNTAKIK